MAQGFREWLQSPVGKYVAVGVVSVLVVVALFVVFSSLGESDAASASRSRTYIDATTGETFNVTFSEGDVSSPVEAPSGGMTGYPAEQCTWTKDGGIRDEPVFVLLNRYVGKDGPTFCEECDRLVQLQNEGAYAGATPPPTRADFESRRNREE
ncbi:MAG: hypothetical protein AAF743_01090 [Planctomycetota bacterium]